MSRRLPERPDVAGSASRQGGDGVFQIGYLRLNGGNLRLGGGQGGLGGRYLELVAHLAFQLFVEQAEAFGVGFHGLLHDGELFVQLEELEIGVGHLAEQGEHQGTLAFFGSEVTRARRFRQTAGLAPDVQSQEMPPSIMPGVSVVPVVCTMLPLV